MIEEAALVTRVSDGRIWVKRLESGACGGCAQQNSCGTAALGKWLPIREFAIESDQPLQTGDHVKVGIDDSHLLLSSLILYLLPLLIVLTGVGLATTLLPPLAEAWMPEIALLLLLASFLVIHRFQNLLLLYFCFRPQIIDKL